MGKIFSCTLHTLFFLSVLPVVYWGSDYYCFRLHSEYSQVFFIATQLSKLCTIMVFKRSHVTSV